MDSALAWIGQIASWIGQWIPRWMILDVTQGGVKYVRGRRIVELKPGVHFWWPVTTGQPDVYPTARQVDNLRTQTIMTADEDQDITIAVGGMVSYEVFDILKLLPKVWRAQAAIKEMSICGIHDVCCKMKWSELKSEQRRGTLDTKLKNELKKTLEGYGVRVVKVQLTDLSRARVYKVMQTTSKDDE
jgi:hypothetical protein